MQFSDRSQLTTFNCLLFVISCAINWRSVTASKDTFDLNNNSSDFGNSKVASDLQASSLPGSLQDGSLHNGSLLLHHSTSSSSDGGVKVKSMIEKIFLWTPSYESGQSYELLVLGNKSNISSSHLQGHQPTYIIVHGFLGDGLEPWILESKQKLLELHRCNVISVQWPSGSEYFVIDYYHVVFHVPYVGQEIAALLAQLAQLKSLKYSDVHIIGHSLGAHIAGFVGKNVPTPIARISGLDPAGLSFRGTGPSQRLDKTDALYVDVIHTNGCRNYLVWTDCFGFDVALGHTDFWPNGGRHQPACQNWAGLPVNGSRPLNGSRHFNNTSGSVNNTDYTRVSVAGSWSVGCDHMMSHTYFVESLNYSRSSGLFLSRPCPSYEEYESGNCSCGSVPQYMGYFADQRGRGDFYLNTSAVPPYALPDPGCPTGAQADLFLLSLVVALVLLVLITCLVLLMTCHGLKRAAMCSYERRSCCCVCCCGPYEVMPAEHDTSGGDTSSGGGR